MEKARCMSRFSQLPPSAQNTFWFDYSGVQEKRQLKNKALYGQAPECLRRQSQGKIKNSTDYCLCCRKQFYFAPEPAALSKLDKDLKRISLAAKSD